MEQSNKKDNLQIAKVAIIGANKVGKDFKLLSLLKAVGIQVFVSKRFPYKDLAMPVVAFSETRIEDLKKAEELSDPMPRREKKQLYKDLRLGMSKQNK